MPSSACNPINGSIWLNKLLKAIIPLAEIDRWLAVICSFGAELRALDIQTVRGGERHRLLDVDLRATQPRSGPQRRINPRATQIGFFQLGVLYASSGQVG